MTQENQHKYKALESQKGLWLNQKLNPNSFADNILRGIKFEGNLTSSHIEQTLDKLLELHPSLRGIFRMEEDILYQHILNKPNYCSLYDAAAWTDLEITSFAQNKQKKPFDLGEEVPFRAYLLQRKSEIVLILVIHHISIDLWSEIILSEQFLRILPSVMQDSHLELKQTSDSFEAFVRCHAEKLTQTRIDDLLNFWKPHCWQKNDPLSLPFSKKRPQVQNYEGSELVLMLSPEIYLSIKKLSSKLKISVYSFLLTVFQIVYYKYSGAKEITIGSTTAGRKHACFRKTVGYFINPIPILLSLKGQTHIEDLFEENFKKIQKYLKHSDLPFPTMVEKLEVKKEPSFHPLFQVMFNYVGKLPFWQTEREINVSKKEKIKLSPLKVTNLLAQFELVVNASVDGKALNLSWQYNTSIFSKTDIQTLMCEYKTFVHNILNQSNRSLYQLLEVNACSDTQKSSLQNCANKFDSIFDWFEASVHQNSKRVAITMEERAFSYEDLFSRVNQIAHFMKKKGIKTGSVVVLYLDLSEDTIASVLAISKLNAVYLPLDKNSPNQRLNSIVKSCDAVVLKSYKSTSPFESDVKVIHLEDIKKEQFKLERGTKQAGLNKNRIAYLIFTSGSTGTAKGVMVPNSAILNYLEWAIKTYFQSHIKTATLFGSLAFDMSLTALFAPLLAGKTLKILLSENIEDNLKQLAFDREIDLCKITPSHLEGLTEIASEAKGSSSLKSMILGGEELKTAVAEKALSSIGSKIKIYNEYGPTEATVGCMIHQFTQNENKKASVPIGIPIQNAQIYVMNEDLQIQPYDVPGELYISGEGLAWGYLRQPVETAKKFIPHPFISGKRIYKTGDLGVKRANGIIEYIGRIDSQLKIRGYRIEKREIEYVIHQVDLVKEALVLMSQGKLIAIIIAKVKNKTEFLDQVKKKVNSLLPKYMVPDHFILIDQLPLSPSGKVDQPTLKKIITEVREEKKQIPLIGSLENSLGQIWSEILKVNLGTISRNDNFFDLGGDSVKLLQTVSRIRRLGYECEYNVFFDYPTIQELASELKPRSNSFLNSPKSAYCQSPELKALNSELSKKHQQAFPLTSIQKGILFHYKSSPASLAYLEQLECTFKGDWCLDSFEKVLSALQKRHQVLDSKLLDIDTGEALTILGVGHKIPFSVSDLSCKSQAEQEHLIEQYKIADLEQGFNLYSEPPLRVSSFKLSATEIKLIWCAHHIVLDGWSLTILLKDFFSMYSTYPQKFSNDLKNGRFEYKDFIHWYMGSDKSKAVNFWNNYLKNVTSPSFVLGNSSQSPIYSFGQLSREIPMRNLVSLLKILNSNRITLNAFLQAAWGVLLAKWNLQKKVVFGTVSNFRPIDLENIENAVGLFVNTLPVRVNIKNQARLLDIVKKVQKDFLEAQPNNFISLSEIIQRKNHPPNLINHLLIFGNYPKATLEKENKDRNFSLSNFKMREQTNYDFNLYINSQEEGKNKNPCLELNFIFNKNVYSEQQINEVAGSFTTLISETDLLNKHFGELEYTAFQRARCLHLTKKTKCDPFIKPLIKIFDTKVKTIPHEVALFYNNRSYTFHYIDDMSTRLAGFFQKNGVKKGDLVALILPRSIDTVCAILAVLKSGATYLPIAPQTPKIRIEQIFMTSKCSFLLTEKLLPLSNKITQFIYDLEAWKNFSENFQPITSDLNQLLYVLFTSGSTGKPKGVMVEQKSVLSLLTHLEGKYPLKKGDAFLLKTSYTFDISCPELFSWILGSGKLIISEENDEKDPETIADVIIKYKVTHINFVPSMLHIFLEVLEPKKLQEVFHNLRYVFSCGEPLRLDTIKKFYSITQEVCLVNLYGPTEATVYATEEECDPNATVVSIGFPIKGISAHLLDDELNDVPPGVIGTLYLEGVGLARGYLNEPRLTAEEFIPSKKQYGQLMYNTGDKATFTFDGKLLFKGRNDCQVKVRGYRVEIQEIEHHLSSFEGIKVSVVKPFKNQGAMDLVAYYVPNRTIKINEISAFLNTKIPSYMTPSFFIEIESVPLTVNGKVDYKQLPDPTHVNAQLGSSINQTFQSSISKELLSLWEETLDLTSGSFDLNKSFFELGGHSLSLMSLLSKIRGQLNRKISIQDFFQNPYLAFLNEQLKCKPQYKSITSQTDQSQKNEFPLTSAQKKIFAHQNIFPDSTAYNLPGTFILKGEIAYKKLESAFRELQKRHEALRLKIKQTSEKAVVQEIQSEPLAQIVYKNVNEDCSQYCVAQLTQPFDLLDSPLLKCYLLRYNSSRALLFFDIHHVIADGISLEVMLKDFTKLYAGIDFEQPKLSYRTFLDYYASMSKATKAEGQNFWSKYLGSTLPLLNFPYDFAKNVNTSYGAKRETHEWPENFSAQITSYAKEKKVTPNILFVAACVILLQKYTGQESFLVGLPASSRDLLFGAESVVGMLVNTLYLKASISPNFKISDVIHLVKENLIEILEHKHEPVEPVLSKLNPDPSINPISFFMAYQEPDLNSLEMQGSEIERLKFNPKEAKFDLSLEVFNLGGKFELNLDYACELTSQNSADLFLKCLKKTLNALIQNDSSYLKEVKILPQNEERNIVIDFNRTEAPFSKKATLDKVLKEKIAREQNQIVVSDNKTSLSALDFEQKILKIASQMKERGVQKGAVVAIICNRSIEMLATMYAIFKLEAAYLPINPSFPVERQKMLLNQAKPSLICFSGFTLLKGSIFESRLLNLEVEVSNSIENSFNSNPKSLAYILYTSGTTGLPKGVLISHQSIVNRLEWMQAAYPLKSDDVILQKTPSTFDVSVWELFLWSFSNAKLFLLNEGDEKDPTALLKTIKSKSVTVMHFVPSMLNAFLDYLKVQPNLGMLPLRKIFVSGEALPKEVVKKFYQTISYVELINLYGPTEATVDVTHFPCSSNPAKVLIGKPIQNHQLYVLDRYMNIQPPGVPGKLYISGVGLAWGYLNEPRLTAKKFLPNPFISGCRMYDTGDVARFNSYGEIEFLGRADRQIKIRGMRIELAEIEDVMLKLEGIQQAAVLYHQEDSTIPGKLIGFVAFLASNSLSEKEINSDLKEVLPEHMIPQKLIVLEKLPLTRNGKLDYKFLEEKSLRLNLETSDLKTNGSTDLENNEVIKKLSEIWQKVLKIEKVYPRDNFFELGGDSILAIQVVANAQAQGLNLNVQDIMKKQTVRSISTTLSLKCAAPINQEKTLGAFPLTPIQAWFFTFAKKDISHFNQAILLTLKEPVKPVYLKKTIHYLLDLHDMLRTKFYIQNSNWVQECLEDANPIIDFHDLSRYEKKDLNEKLAQVKNSAQKSLAIELGALLNIQHLKLPEGKEQLLFICHHLVIDGVSWRFFLEDFCNIYRQVSTEAEIVLPFKTNSYKSYANEIQSIINQPLVLDYWKNQVAPMYYLPVDFGNPDRVIKKLDKYRTILEEKVTYKLFTLSQSHYKCQIEELLLKALLDSIYEKWNIDSIAINFESHGRTSNRFLKSYSRTLGWFTSLYPVFLRSNSGESIADNIQLIKKSLKAAEKNSIDFAVHQYLMKKTSLQSSQICFNFHGKLDQVLTGLPLFEQEYNPETGKVASDLVNPPHLVAFNIFALGSQLHIECEYSKSNYSSMTIEAFLKNYKEKLKALTQFNLLSEKLNKNTSRVSASSLEKVFSQLK